MDRSEIVKIIEKFQESFDKYHKLFLDNYPLPSYDENDFGSREMNDLGIECQAYISMLGNTAKTRMNYIGLNQLFAFDNEVDWYNWKIWVFKNEVNITPYLSISVRIDTELKRMRFFLSEDMWEVYYNLKEDEYSVSYLSYDVFHPKSIEPNEDGIQEVTDNISHPIIQDVVNNHPEEVEKDVFNNIDQVEKRTSIMANIATFLARISGL